MANVTSRIYLKGKNDEENVSNVTSERKMCRIFEKVFNINTKSKKKTSFELLKYCIKNNVFRDEKEFKSSKRSMSNV